MTKTHLLTKGPVLMGVVNVTPDSFYEGSRFSAPQQAIAQALRLIEEGAAIIDIGGESSRPGAKPVSVAEELDRVMPVIEGLKGCNAIISVDTRNAITMKQALAAGAGMINDITALTGDPESVSVLASYPESLLCLMHMRGNPETMQQNPWYSNVVQEIIDFLHERIAFCETAGIKKNRLIADPGIGFGKSLEDNLLLIRDVSKMHDLGVPILIGLSRKSFIERIFSGVTADQRTAGSIAASLWCMQQGVQIFRVHDVAQTRQAFAVFQAIENRFPEGHSHP